jgi:hypothetical protein
MSSFEPAGGDDRRAFMRRVGGILAAGLGLTLVGSRSALAAPTSCCKDSTCPSCPGAAVRYKCMTSDSGHTCCMCHTDVGQCYGTQLLC